MIEVQVERSAGNKQGPDIVDSLVTAIQVAIARGTAEINTSCSNRKSLSIATVLLPFTMPGGLVRITTYKGSRIGKLTSFQKEYILTDTEFTAECSMNVEVIDER